MVKATRHFREKPQGENLGCAALASGPMGIEFGAAFASFRTARRLTSIQAPCFIERRAARSSDKAWPAPPNPEDRRGRLLAGWASCIGLAGEALGCLRLATACDPGRNTLFRHDLNARLQGESAEHRVDGQWIGREAFRPFVLPCFASRSWTVKPHQAGLAARRIRQASCHVMLISQAVRTCQARASVGLHGVSAASRA